MRNGKRKVIPDPPPMKMKMITARPSEARYDKTTLRIR